MGPLPRAPHPVLAADPVRHARGGRVRSRPRAPDSRAIAVAVRSVGLSIRAGCHTGEVELVGEDVLGVAVHIGARVAALAGPEEVWTSSTVKDLTMGSDLVFEDVGKHELKGVPDRWHLYRVVE
jgi:class 3 adenylate cyclase